MDEMRRILRHREFRLLWMATSASTLGDHIVFVALALYVSEIGTPTDVGIVLAAHAHPARAASCCSAASGPTGSSATG